VQVHDLALLHRLTLELAYDAPSRMTSTRSHMRYLFQLARDQDSAVPSRRDREEAVDLLFRGHVHAARRLVDDHQRAAGSSVFASDTFCWFPRTATRAGVQIACLDAKRWARSRFRAFLLVVDDEAKDM